MGDGRANNITAQYSDYIYPYTNLSETSLSQGLTDAWNSFYSVVAQANNTINNITDYSAPTLSEDSKRVSIAEARFMRGTAYWYIASLWGVGIIYTNTSSMVNNYVVPANPGVDVIEFAIRDLEYAAKYLPKTPADAGRVTCYSAYGMLSRVTSLWPDLPPMACITEATLPPISTVAHETRPTLISRSGQP